MIRFHDVWDLYKQKKIVEEEPLTKDDLSQLVSKQGNVISDVIDSVVTFQTVPVLNEIGKVNEDSKELKGTLVELEALSAKVEDAESKVRNFFALNTHDNYTFGHIVRIIKLGDAYDRKALAFFNNSYEAFEKSLAKFKEAESAEHIGQARKSLDSVHDVCYNALGLTKRRGMLDYVSAKVDGKLEKYMQNREKVKEVREKIDDLFQRYRTLELDSKCPEILEDIKKKIKSGLLFKGKLLSESIEAGYVEGTESLKSLEKEIDFVSDKYYEVAAKKRDIGKDMAKIAELLPSINNLYGRELSSKELEALVESKKSLRHDKHSAYSSPFYLKEHVENYNAAAKELAAKIKPLIDAEKQRLYSSLNDIRSMTVPDLFLEVPNYIASARKANSALDELMVKFSTLEDKEAYNKALKLVKDNENTIKGVSDASKEYEIIVGLKTDASRVSDKLRSDVNLDKIAELSSLVKKADRSVSISYDGLRKEYSIAKEDLDSEIDRGIKNAVASVDALYNEAKSDDSKNLDYICSLYSKLGEFTDTSGKVGEVKKLIARRKEEDGKIANLSSQISSLQQAIRKNEEKLANSLKDRSATQKEASRYSQIADELSRELSSLKGEMGKYEKSLGEKDKHLARREQELGSAYRQIDELGARLGKLEDQAKDYQSKADDERKKRESLEAQLEKAKVEAPKGVMSSNNGKNFSLPLYMEGIGQPLNFKYIKLKNILSAQNGEKDWAERMASLRKIVNNGLKIGSQDDVDYLKKIAYGIERAIACPVRDFNVTEAKKAYQDLTAKLSACT
jgi:DNA repair exonuclease SbcCD ATPase subunit